jgi:hypothetical protein
MKVSIYAGSKSGALNIKGRFTSWLLKLITIYNQKVEI